MIIILKGTWSICLSLGCNLSNNKQFKTPCLSGVLIPTHSMEACDRAVNLFSLTNGVLRIKILSGQESKRSVRSQSIRIPFYKYFASWLLESWSAKLKSTRLISFLMGRDRYLIVSVLPTLYDWSFARRGRSVSATVASSLDKNFLQMNWKNQTFLHRMKVNEDGSENHLVITFATDKLRRRTAFCLN